jgi:Uma2 family endonuclease
MAMPALPRSRRRGTARVSSAHAAANDVGERPIMHMAPATKQWTLDELHSLPDDGNKYELIHGELFVTPAPAPTHETILARLRRALEPYVVANDLGLVFSPRSIVQIRGSEVEPDLMVRTVPKPLPRDWAKWPVPILVVEVNSPTTRRRDNVQKRDFYLEIGVPEYWIVDPPARNVRTVKRNTADDVVSEALFWEPPGVNEPLRVDVRALFADVADDE